MKQTNMLTLPYYKNERRFLASLINNKVDAVLDIGCGAGYFGKFLKESGKAKSVYGVELVKEVAEHAAQHLDGVICGDLDEIDLVSKLKMFNEGVFDIIVFADVLEHTKNPWDILQKSTLNLKQNGLVIISLPNVRHWKVLRDLVFADRWDYRDSGVLDRTHLRFFTKSTSLELLSISGLSVEQVHSLMGCRASALSRITAGIADRIFAEQFVLVGRKR